MASENRDQRAKSVSLGQVSKWDNIQSDVCTRGRFLFTLASYSKNNRRSNPAAFKFRNAC
jgi:hypothetical protein